MKKFAVAYIGTTMPKWDRAEIRKDKVEFWRKNVLVYSSDVRFAAQAHSIQNLSIEFVEAETGEEAMKKVTDRYPFMIKELTAAEIV